MNADRQHAAARLDSLADICARDVERRRAPLSQRWTARRARIKDGQRAGADRLEQVERGLRALARALRENRLPGCLASSLTRQAVERLTRAGPNDPKAVALAELVVRYADADAWKKDEERRAADELRALEDAHRLRAAPGFFPTPPAVAEALLEALDVQPGHVLLEPSAGLGHLAEAARARGAEVRCVEVSPSLVEVLERRGLAVQLGDFLELAPALAGAFDRVAMNPPFERGADAVHVRAALACLRPGGRLVSVVTPRTAELLAAELGGRVEPLPDGSFAGPDTYRPTSVRCALLVVDRPA